MTSYAELLGIDLDKLETERFSYYRVATVQPDPKAPDNPADWQTLTFAANNVKYSTQTINNWKKAGKLRWHKRNGRVYVFMPDVLRHAKA
jgi:hypothetical protein